MRSVVAIALALLLPLPARALDETEQFRQSALEILIQKGLGRIEPGTYVCLDIDQRSASQTELARARSSSKREVGAADDCKCAEAEPADQCTRVGTSQRACMLSVYGFEFRAFTHARASMTVACGWPRGYGETARFEKRADRWQYIEAVSLIKF